MTIPVNPKHSVFHCSPPWRKIVSCIWIQGNIHRPKETRIECGEFPLWHICRVQKIHTKNNFLPSKCLTYEDFWKILKAGLEIWLLQKELMVTLLCCRIASMDNSETCLHCSIPKWVKQGRFWTANSTHLILIFGQKLNVKSVKALQCFKANITPSSVISCEPKLNSSRSSK